MECEKTKEVLKIIYDYGSIDGSQHKQWVLDQIIHALTGDDYNTWVSDFENGEAGPQTYEWDTGTAP